MNAQDPFGGVDFSFSPGLIVRLARLGIALAFTARESGFLYMLGSSGEHGAQLHQSLPRVLR